MLFIQTELADGKVIVLNAAFITNVQEVPSPPEEPLLQVYLSTGPFFVIKEDIDSFLEAVYEVEYE